MVERLATIGRRVADAVIILRSGDRNRKPEFPLSPVERHHLKKECGEILEKENFGRGDFGNFCQNMIALSREVELKGSVGLNDQNRNFIYFKDNSIETHSLPDLPEDTNISKIELVASREELVSYKGSQPVLDSTTTTIIVPKPTDIFYYFSGKQNSALVGAIRNINESVKVSDKNVQAFCRRAYSVYTGNR